MMRRADWLALAPVAAVVPYFMLVVNRPGRTDGLISFDIYNYYYPNMLYAVRSLRDGTRGLWWNALLDCGQPFFANNFAGVLYPANVLWLLLQPDTALRSVIAFNLLVAGVSAYLLGRTLGTGPLAALCGALAFQLSNATVRFSTWGPQTGGPYVWMPAALLGCERILQKPTFGRALFLAVVLAISLLPGFPQVVFFTYQLIALRVVWEFATGRVTHPLRTLACVGFGLCLPPLLVAVQFIPALELTGLSVRQAALSQHELAPSGFMDWSAYRFAPGFRSSYTNPLLLVPCMLGALAAYNRRTRRHAIFYLATGFLYFVLAFGPNTPVFRAYMQLPFGTLFRDPVRFMWVPGFCLAMLTALGADALVSRSNAAVAWPRLVPVATIVASVAFAFYLLLPDGFLPNEWAIAAVTVIAVLVAFRAPEARTWMGIVIVVALLGNLLIVHRTTFVRLLPDGALLYAQRSVFEALQQRMTPQDRVHLITSGRDFSLEPKTASLFGIPAVYDYEPAPTRRYAEYFVMLRTGSEMTSLNQLYYSLDGPTPPGFRRRLLDLAAGRYVVAGRRSDQTATVIHPPLRLLAKHPTLRVYENPQALPRTFYVPRVEVVAEPSRLLRRLADGSDDLRQLALIEERPPSGFLGEADGGLSGTAEFTRNDPEHVVIRVHAPARGFLVLADQYFPGWQAAVNGGPVPILRANFLFRLVEVPDGESLVEFRYQPAGLRLGAAVSALTCIAIASAWILWSRRRHWRTAQQ